MDSYPNKRQLRHFQTAGSSQNALLTLKRCASDWRTMYCVDPLMAATNDRTMTADFYREAAVKGLR